MSHGLGVSWGERMAVARPRMALAAAARKAGFRGPRVEQAPTAQPSAPYVRVVSLRMAGTELAPDSRRDWVLAVRGQEELQLRWVSAWHLVIERTGSAARSASPLLLVRRERESGVSGSRCTRVKSPPKVLVVAPGREGGVGRRRRRPGGQSTDQGPRGDEQNELRTRRVW